MILNAWQRAVAATYDEGAFDYLVEDGAIDPGALDTCGDTLFKFLMIELADKEGCGANDEAIRRCVRAREQLDDAISALERLGTTSDDGV